MTNNSPAVKGNRPIFVDTKIGAIPHGRSKGTDPFSSAGKLGQAPAEGIDLWYVRLDEITDAAEFDRCRAILSADERERLRRFTHKEAGWLFLVGRGLLRRTLARYIGRSPRELEFRYNAHGKPSLAAPDGTRLEFSLSHTRGLVACAVGFGCRLGVDVERERAVDNALEIARRFFAPTEAAGLEKLSPKRRSAAFLDLWTLREALAKARGAGLASLRGDYALSLSGDNDVSVTFNESSDEKPADWQVLRLRPVPGYRAALAVGRAE